MKKLLSICFAVFMSLSFLSCNSLNTKDVFYVDGRVSGAYTYNDCIEMLGYVKSNNMKGFNEMYNKGKLISLSDGTKIKIIEIRSSISKVKNIYTNTEFWLSNDFISPVDLSKAKTRNQY